jgi:hypothetical protein
MIESGLGKVQVILTKNIAMQVPVTKDCKSICLYDFESRTSYSCRDCHDEQPDYSYLIDSIKTMQKSYFEALSKKKDYRFSI